MIPTIEKPDIEQTVPGLDPEKAARLTLLEAKYLRVLIGAPLPTEPQDRSNVKKDLSPLGK